MNDISQNIILIDFNGLWKNTPKYNG